MTKVLLFSGGMDCLAAQMLHDPDVLLYVDAGTRYTEAEMKRLPAGTTIARLPFLNNHLAVDDIIPLRNLFSLQQRHFTVMK